MKSLFLVSVSFAGLAGLWVAGVEMGFVRRPLFESTPTTGNDGQDDQEESRRPHGAKAPKSVQHQIAAVTGKLEAGASEAVPLAAPKSEYPLQSAYARFQTGDYEGAVSLLRIAFKHSPNDEARKNLSTALFALALLRIQQNNFSEAEVLLDESARLGNDDAASALARVKLKQGNTDAAAGLFEDLFDKTRDPASLRALVSITLREDSLDRAEYFLNRLEDRFQNTATPADDNEKSFLASHRKRLEQKRLLARNQETVERGMIEVSFLNASQKSTADAVADAMEKVLQELLGYLGPLPIGKRIRATLVPTLAFQDSTGAPPWAGALFDGVVRIPVPAGTLSNGQLSDLTRMARHEMTHAYFFAFCGATLPSWLGEGLAQKFEGRAPAQSVDYLVRTLGRRALQTVDQKDLDQDFVEAPDTTVRSLYARALVLTDVIARENNGDTVWKNVLQQACQVKVPFADALENLAGASQASGLWSKYREKILSIY